MKSLKEYSIKFKGLKDGIHVFNYEVDDRFFEKFEKSEVEKADITIKLTLNKRPQYLELDFDLAGIVNVQCDRCLDYFNLPIEYQGRLYVKFVSEATEVHDETSDMVVMSQGESELNIAQYIYEFIILSLPYQRVHPDDENGESMCNEEMLKRLEDYEIDESDNSIDPRWEKLKSIKNRKSK